MLTSVGSYASRPAAEEHGLVVLAMQLPCWILRPDGVGSDYLLAVEPADAGKANAEIQAYERDLAEADRAIVRSLPNFSSGRWYAILYALVLAAGFQYQLAHPDSEERFIADSTAIVEHHETYRAATALLLHGDTIHLLSNIAYGAGFGLLVAASIGARTGWLLIALSGFLGNLANAYQHYGQWPHRSLGASTAVFGAIGILAGFGLIAAFLSPKSAPWARAILPIAGGIAILGLYGLGSSRVDGTQIDFMAHIFGFAVGVPLGVIAGAWRILAANRHPDPAGVGAAQA